MKRMFTVALMFALGARAARTVEKSIVQDGLREREGGGGGLRALGA